MIQTALYDISGAIAEILNREEWDEQAELDLESLGMAMEAKAASICHFVANLEGFEAAAEAEEKRIAGRRKAARTRIDRLKNYLKAGMIAADRTELEAGTNKIRLQKNPPAVVVDDESQLPSKFFTIIPEQYTVDKKAISSAIKAGEDVKGAHLEQGVSLRIV